jgi:integrase/recombinase XerD
LSHNLLSTSIKTNPHFSTSTTTTSSPTSPLFDRKMEETCAGLQQSFLNTLYSVLNKNKDNATTIVNYIETMRSEVNLCDNYRRNLIRLLPTFSNYCHNKNFKDIVRADVLTFLDTLRKTETQDPLHKWIGTYNLYRVHLLRFFKWLYSPDLEPDKRPKPPVVENVFQLKRKEKSIYKPSDLWTPEDDLLFLEYCPTKREKCYHAISRDLSCRPSEILRLKIKDIAFKTIGTSQYAEVVVNGKTGTRPIPLINSIPYLKDYLDHEHPQPRNPNAPLICGIGRGLGRHIQPLRLFAIYKEYKEKIFPKLLESPNVLPEAKQRIQELLKKPWNPYIRRHSALTEKSTILKEHVLRQHAGWTPGSQMHLKYLHYFGNESNKSILEEYGLIGKGIQLDRLRPKQCTNCNEPNKPDSRFCAKCRMVLTYDAFSETLEKQQEKESEIQILKQKYENMEERFQKIIEKIEVANLK